MNLSIVGYKVKHYGSQNKQAIFLRKIKWITDSLNQDASKPQETG